MALLDRLFGNRGIGSIASIRNLAPRFRLTKKKTTYHLKKPGMEDFWTNNPATARSMVRNGYSCSPTPPEPTPKTKEEVTT